MSRFESWATLCRRRHGPDEGLPRAQPFIVAGASRPQPSAWPGDTHTPAREPASCVSQAARPRVSRPLVASRPAASRLARSPASGSRARCACPRARVVRASRCARLVAGEPRACVAYYARASRCAMLVAGEPRACVAYYARASRCACGDGRRRHRRRCVATFSNLRFNLLFC
jgi:hypothetical protein